jgi:uncharacterized protein YjbI with pentapeptide repeats
MGFFADLFGTPKPAPAVIIYNVLHEEIDRVEGRRYLWGQDLCGRNWSHADLSGLSLYGAQFVGTNLFRRTVTQGRLPNGITSRRKASVQLRSRCEFSWF